MKILFVYPKTIRDSVVTDYFLAAEPLALEYLGAGLSKHHDVLLLDMRHEDNLHETVKNFSPDIVGLTGYTVHVNAVKKVSREVKEINPDILTVVGGHHASVSPQDFYEPYIDIVVKGEGVFTFKEIVERVEKKQSLADIEGTSVRVNGEFKENKMKIISDLDSFPLPDRRLRERAQVTFQEFAIIVTSKGCPYRCNFCSCWEATGGKYLTRDIQSVVEELKTIKEDFLHFADDESFIYPKRMMQLAELIEKEGIKKRYFTHVRSDTVLKHPELIRKWKDIGMTALSIGVEAHREKDLKYYNKKTSVSQNLEAIKILKELGVWVIGTLIVHQDFDEKDFDEFANFVNNSQIDIAFLSILTPFPGTRLYKEQQANLLTHNYDLYDFFHTVLPTRLPLKNFYREFYHLHIKVAKLNVKGFTKLTSMVDGSSYMPSGNIAKWFNSLKYAYLDY